MFWDLSPTASGSIQVEMEFGNLEEIQNLIHPGNHLYEKIQIHSQIPCQGTCQ